MEAGNGFALPFCLERKYEMKLHNLKNREHRGYTTWGCIWEKGTCGTETIYALKDKDGTDVPVQSRITAYWPDNSVKWTAHTAQSELLSDEIEVYPVFSDKEQNTMAREPEHQVKIQKNESGMKIQAGQMELEISDKKHLFHRLSVNGTTRLCNAVPVLLLEEPVLIDGCRARVQKEYEAQIDQISIEEDGPLLLVIKYEGSHITKNGESKIPFIIRMKVGINSSKVDFVHTFFYDGEEETDFLKGSGVRFEAPMEGELYNRHVKFEGDHGYFHEALAELLSWKPRVPEGIYEDQMLGRRLSLEGEPLKIVNQVLKDMPFWSEYELVQDSASHFGIRKKIYDESCCYLDCLSGNRTKGAAAFGSDNGSILFCIRDFWEKYPSGYTFKNLDQTMAEATIWLWSPGVEAFDFRHYANRGYNQVYYEGYDFKGADPYGIACTSEFSLCCITDLIPEDKELELFSEAVNRPAQYVGDPEYYHQLKAFGYWSLPSRTTEMENWLEDQLDQAVGFYEQEVEQRNWYGMFNYGDFMHTYDKQRNQWRYDMGGYAWDNTELVPTLWLWSMFMRSGRDDIFTLAEKLSRHASEVDVYHFGPYKGMGSRHNVRHWGCPCKEARIAMAAHHRFYYYMTGDHRMEDIFEELKDNEMSFLNKDPLEAFYDKETMVYPSHARSGPDWSSLCANWMTQWERFQDERYHEKITIGIEDIKKTPLQLVSGPDFEFDPATTHLRYIGERAAGGTHLQICMGAPQIWMELTDLLGDEQWKRMIAEYGRFYYLPREEQLKESEGIIGDREFSLPFMAAAMGAYGAWYLKDKELAKVTWKILLNTLIYDGDHEGFEIITVADKGNQKMLKEIPWISTNFVAQWCLNVITVLEFIREELPETLNEVDELVKLMPMGSFHKA